MRKQGGYRDQLSQQGAVLISQQDDGFDGIDIGRSDGRHQIEIESDTFRDSVQFNAPEVGGVIVTFDGSFT